MRGKVFAVTVARRCLEADNWKGGAEDEGKGEDGDDNGDRCAAGC